MTCLLNVSSLLRCRLKAVAAASVTQKASISMSPTRQDTKERKFKLAPSIPLDTPKTNPFLNNEEHVPNFSIITPYNVVNGYRKAVANFQYEMETLIEELSEKKEVTFDSFFLPFQKVQVALEDARNTAQYFALSHPYTKYHSAYFIAYEEAVKVSNDFWRSKKVYPILKKIKDNKQQSLTPAQKRLLDYYMRIFWVMSPDLEKNNAYRHSASEVQKQQEIFQSLVLKSNSHWKFVVKDRKLIEDMPEEVLNLLSVNKFDTNLGPWEIKSEHFNLFMNYCSNRKLRKDLYDAYHARASVYNDAVAPMPQYCNTFIIDKILKHQHVIAIEMGHEDYAHYINSVFDGARLNNITDSLEKVRSQLRPVVDEELDRLQEYSERHGNKSDIEYYDIDYWITRHTDEHFRKKNHEIMNYFPTDKVLDGLLKFTGHLFNITFKEDKAQSSKFPMPSSTIVYNIINNDTNEHVSSLVVVPYKNGKNKVHLDNIYSFIGRESCTMENNKPLVYLNLSLDKPESPSSSVFLTFDEVSKLFFEFGQSMQILLAKTEYFEFSNVASQVDREYRGLTSRLFAKFLMTPQVIRQISSHKNTGQPLPTEYLDLIKNEKRNFKLFTVMEELLLVVFDIECHLKKHADTRWFDIYDQLWPKFMPFGKDEQNSKPCQAGEIFFIGRGAISYRTMWTRMICEDIYQAFKEVGFDSESELQRIGTKFRNTILIPSATEKLMDRFLQFRGRDLSPYHFINANMPNYIKAKEK